MKAAQALNIDELRALARRRLPRVMADYLDGGAEDHVTLQANRAAFEALRFAPRTLVDVSRRSQKATLFGRVYESPVGIAPIGACGLFRHEGDIALARAARSANIPFVASTHAFVPLRRLAWEAGGPPWYQLYLPPSRELARKMVQHAADAGCEALVLTTDVPVGGKREYNDRNGFGMPLRVSGRMVADALAHPRWLLGVFARAWLAQDYAMLVPEWHTRRDHASWSDLAWLRETWKGKLLVKGVLCAEDAQLAAEHGADGIWVSNHGGRQLDGAPSPLEVLPQIAAAVGERVTIMVDGGVRRGSDVAKALALGADLVFVGRAAMYGLAAGGEAGVRRALQILRGELDRVLALLGCNSIGELGPHFLRPAGRESAAVRSLAAARARSI